MFLLLSLFSPIVELFPNLYMSWWLPSNGKLAHYLSAWPRRVLVVVVVWLPILFTLGFITSTLVQLSISLLVFGAFGLRLYLFDHALHKLGEKEMHNFVEPIKLPEILYFIAFSSIGFVLYHAVPDKSWLVPAAILTIYLGAFMMATFRAGSSKNLSLDILGRCVFTAGFLCNLYNLARAAF